MPARPSRLISPKNASAGFFSLAVATGALAGVAAETASAGHVIALRNSKTAAFHVTFMRLWWTTTAGPTAAQRFGVAAKKLTGYSAAHTGSTGGSNVQVAPRDVSFVGRDAASGEDGSGLIARVAGTDALTAGTQTIADKLGELQGQELAAGAAVPLKNVERVWSSSDKFPLFILKQNEGLLVANQVLEGAALAALVGLELHGWVRQVG